MNIFGRLRRQVVNDKREKEKRDEFGKTVKRVSDLLRVASLRLSDPNLRKRIATECAETYYTAIRRVLDRVKDPGSCQIVAPLEIRWVLPHLARERYMTPGILRSVAYTTKAQFVAEYSNLFEGCLSAKALSYIPSDETAENISEVKSMLTSLYGDIQNEELLVPPTCSLGMILADLDEKFRLDIEEYTV